MDINGLGLDALLLIDVLTHWLQEKQMLQISFDKS